MIGIAKQCNQIWIIWICQESFEWKWPDEFLWDYCSSLSCLNGQDSQLSWNNWILCKCSDYAFNASLSKHPLTCSVHWNILKSHHLSTARTQIIWWGMYKTCRSKIWQASHYTDCHIVCLESTCRFPHHIIIGSQCYWFADVSCLGNIFWIPILFTQL